MLSEDLDEYQEVPHLYNFKLKNGELYFNSKDTPLTTNRGMLRFVGGIRHRLGVIRLRALGFDITKDNVTHQKAAVLNRVKEELPSASDVAKADGIELKEITDSAARSTNDLIPQLKGQEMLSMCKLQGLSK